ncbi:MAG: LacI family DNA-binding transcriptional regulator [Planctomycetota bacterium]|nr:LacI family DNA-binding transcriptional regulator [Planctomycetota bacterium]
MATKSPPAGPGLSDVAAAAKVSIATVSRVLTGKANVAEEARMRVLEAVRRLNYKPLRRPKQSLQARQTPDGVKPTIAYLCHDEYQTGLVKWGSAFAAATRRLQEAGCRLIMHFLPGRKGDAPIDPNATRLPEQFSALIAVDRGDANWVRLVTSSGHPAVRIGYYPLNLAIPQLVGDTFNGSLRLMEHLINKGHRRIGIWRVHAENATGEGKRAQNERDKYAAYRYALDEAGIEYNKSWEVDMPFEWRQVPERAKQLLAAKPAPTALFIDNDWVTARIQAMNGNTDGLPPDWFRQFEIAHFIDMGKDPAEYGLACAALAMDRMGELGAGLLLEQLSGHRFGPDYLLRVNPYFFTAEQVIESSKRLV